MSEYVGAFFFSLSQMTTANDNINKFKQFDQYDFDKDSQFQVYMYSTCLICTINKNRVVSFSQALRHY